MSSSNQSLTVKMAAGLLKKSDYVIIKGHPCKITHLSKFKPGKHGPSKVHIIGTDIFDQRRHETVLGCQHEIDTPFVTRQEYQVNNVSYHGFLSLMDDEGTVRDDLRLHAERDVDARVQEAFDKVQEAG